MAESLKKTALSALRWNYVGLVVRSLSTFAIGIILARLLGPRPFGELAAVILVFGLANQLVEGGFSSALVQAPQLTDIGIRCAFTIQLLSAAVMTLSTGLAAPYLGQLFHDSEIESIIRAVVPVFLLQSFGQTSAGLLKRRLEFKAIQRAQISSYLLGYL